MANTLALNITAVDRATRVIQNLNKRVDQMTRPLQNARRSLQQFGKAAGFDTVRKKLEGLTRTAKGVASAFARIGAPLLALVGGGTIAGLVALTDGFARFGQRLTQTAQILGVNTQQLYNFQNAAKLVGISGEAATQAFSGFADTLQDARFGRNQQALGLLVGLNVQLHKTRTGSIDAMDALGQIADRIQALQKSGNTGGARTLASQLGLTSLMPFLMQGRAGIQAYQRQAQQLTGGQNWQQAAAAGMQWNRMRVAIEGTSNAIASTLLPTITPLVQQFGQWISENRALIATDLQDFIKEIGNAFKGLTLKEVLDDILGVVRGLMSLAKGAARVTADLGGVKVVLGTLAGLWAVDKVVRFGFAFYQMAKWIGAAREALMAWRGVSALAGVGEAAAAAAPALGIAAGVAGVGYLGYRAVQLARARSAAGQAQAFAKSTAASGAPSVMRFFQNQGWSAAQAAGITANIQAESGFNPQAWGDHGHAYGIGQWHADRLANFNAWAKRGKLKDYQHADLIEQLQFYDYELKHTDAGRRLRGAQSAYDAGSIVSLYGERPADAQGEAARRGALATQMAGIGATPTVNVSVQNTIHKDGSAKTRVTTPAGVKIVHTSPVEGVS